MQIKFHLFDLQVNEQSKYKSKDNVNLEFLSSCLTNIYK